MSRESERVDGRPTGWQPERSRRRLLPLLASWLASGVALMVAAGILPGVSIEGFWGALLVAVIVAALNAVIPPVLAALRLPLTLVLGFLLVLVADAVILLVAADLTDGAMSVDNFGWALLTALVVAAVSTVLAVVLGSDGMSADPDRATDRPPAGDHRPHRRSRGRVPRDRRARAARAAPCDARRQRPDDGPLAGRRVAQPDRVGDRSLLADGRQPGGHPAGLQRGHPGVPLGGEGERDADDVLGAARLCGDRAPARDRHRPAHRRRSEPREPAVRRSRGRDPDGQPDGCGEEVQPGLPGVPRRR